MRDYYEVLGVERDCRRGRAEGGLPQAGDGAPSRPQRRLRGGRGAVQGDQRGLFGPVRSAEARGLRPLRPCRRRTAERRRRRRVRRRARHLQRGVRRRLRRHVRRRPARRQSGPARGQDLRYDLEITLEQAYRGAEVEITVPAAVHCETCEGSGAKPGTSPTTCDTCGGPGRVRAAQGFFPIERTCPRCGGAGRVILDPCRDLPRPRPGAARAHAAGAHPGRRRRRRAHPPGRRGRRRRARRPARRPLHLPLGARRTSCSSATAWTCSAPCRCRCPRPRSAARSRRPACSAARTATAAQGQGQGPRRRPDRQHRAPAGPGHAVAALARARRPGGRTVRRDPDRASRQQKELMREFAGALRRPPESQVGEVPEEGAALLGGRDRRRGPGLASVRRFPRPGGQESAQRRHQGERLVDHDVVLAFGDDDLWRAGGQEVAGRLAKRQFAAADDLGTIAPEVRHGDAGEVPERRRGRRGRACPRGPGRTSRSSPRRRPSGIGARFSEARAMKSAMKRLPGICGGRKRNRARASARV